MGGWEDVGNGKEVRIIYGARWIDIDISYVIKWTKPFPPFLHIIRDPKLYKGSKTWGRGTRRLDKATLLLSCDLLSGSLFPSAVRPQQNRFMIIKVWYRTICFHDNS